MTMVVVWGSLLIIALITDLLIWWWHPKPQQSREFEDEFPAVTIMVAMRNERENLPQMIHNLRQLDYPAHKIQLLVGEDRSEDGTAGILEQIARDDQGIEIIPIKENLGNLKGKANVLAQLIPRARHDYLLITDADVRVPPAWIKSYLSYMHDDLAVLGASTVVGGDNLWSKLQNMDWLLAQSMLCTAGARFHTLAVSGTNMLITKSACQAIGGYENLPYSLTEDIGFLTAVQAQNLGSANLWDPQATAVIGPQKDWSALLNQRRRWTYGATKLPWLVVFLLFIRALFLPVALALFFWKPWWAMGLLLTRLLLQGILINKMAARLRQSWSVSHLLIFEVYYTMVTLGGVILFILPLKFSWKGRKYS